MLNQILIEIPWGLNALSPYLSTAYVASIFYTQFIHKRLQYLHFMIEYYLFIDDAIRLVAIGYTQRYKLWSIRDQITN